MEEEKEKLIGLIKDFKYKFQEPEKIISAIEETISVETLPFVSDQLEIGCSKFGGTPDLPTGIDWPKFNQKSMVFFGQINLAEVSNLDKKGLLPKNGILYFFSYFDDPTEYGANYDYIKNKDEYKVIFYDGDTNNLRITNFPLDLNEEYHFTAERKRFYLQYQIPPTHETYKIEKLSLSKEDIYVYMAFENEYNNRIDSMLGTPYPLQSGADHYWLDSFLNNFTDLNSPGNNEEIRSQFINLLSFDMYSNFGSIGTSFCFFGILEKDLKEKKFENVIFVMQGT